MFRSASLFIGTSLTVAVFTTFATSNIDSIAGIHHKIYSMQGILIQMKSRYAPRVCSEPGGQKPVLSLSLDHIASCKPYERLDAINCLYVQNYWRTKKHTYFKILVQERRNSTSCEVTSFLHCRFFAFWGKVLELRPFLLLKILTSPLIMGFI